MTKETGLIVAIWSSQTGRLAGNDAQFIRLNRAKSFTVLMIAVAEVIKILALSEQMKTIAQFTGLYPCQVLRRESMWWIDPLTETIPQHWLRRRWWTKTRVLLRRW
jgi:hypothetical protein